MRLVKAASYSLERFCLALLLYCMDKDKVQTRQTL